MVSGDFSGGMYEIFELISSTIYTIEVAAENSAGTGVYSDPITVLNLGELLVKYVVFEYLPPTSCLKFKLQW